MAWQSKITMNSTLSHSLLHTDGHFSTLATISLKERLTIQMT